MLETDPRPVAQPRTPGPFLWAILAAALALVVGVPFWIGLHKGWTGLFPQLPVEGTVRPFALIDQDGRPARKADLLGKVWVADFIYTHCPGPCPMMTRRMRKLQDLLPAPVRMVSFSVDPERDTPAVLKAYAERAGADERRWKFLTGGREHVYALLKEGFHLMAPKGGAPEADMLHSTRFVLVDREGKIRGYYDGTGDQDLGRLVHDVQQLLE